MTSTAPRSGHTTTTRFARAKAGVVRWMSDASTPNPGVRPVVRRDIGLVLVVWIAGRFVNLAFLGVWYLCSKIFGWSFGAQGLQATDFLSFLTAWDGDRYGRIARIGYPLELPIDANGTVFPNDWAFMPVYPLLERALADLTGWGWQVSGVTLSIAASAGATVMLYLLLRAVVAPTQAWWAVVLFTFGPLSFIFVLAYAESLFLFLLFLGLWLAVRRQYAWILPVGVVLAFTRPGALALSLALGILFLVRWARHRVDPFRRREVTALAASGGAIALAGLSWSWIMEAIVGMPHAYVLTETAWWRPYLGDVTFVPLTPSFLFAHNYLGLVGIVVVLAAMVGFGMLVWSKPVRRLGVVVAAFIVSYGLYLFGVFLPQQSLFRLLLPVSPLLGHEKLSATPRIRRLTLGGALVLQALTTLVLWTVGYP